MKTIEKVFVSTVFELAIYMKIEQATSLPCVKGNSQPSQVSKAGYRKQWTRLSLRRLEVRKVSTLRLQSCHSCLRHLVPFTHAVQNVI